MAEEQPFGRADEPKPTRVRLEAPNVNSTFDRPPDPDALRAHDAVIRRHLRRRRRAAGEGQADVNETP